MNDKETFPIECPICGKASDSIKLFTLPGVWISLLFFLYHPTVKQIGCPSCMRKKILMQGFTYNIFTGNVYWLLMILPWSLINFLRSFSKGHSREVYDYIDYGK